MVANPSAVEDYIWLGVIMAAHQKAVSQVPELVRDLYALVAKLEALFPGRRFTPDGHLVGSIGEVIAAHDYNLVLAAASTENLDATAPDGRAVQIKATQRSTVALRSEPQHLLVLRISEDGSWSEIYNGPGSLAWSKCGPMQSNGQRPISVSRLRGLMSEVSTVQRLAKRDGA